MKLRVAVYAACMLVTGTINTISTKFQDLSVVGHKPDGSAILFQHPAFQSACMFLGEALCLIPYFYLRWRRRAWKKQQGIPSKPRPPVSYLVKRTLAFAIPTLCDATGTTLLNIGLFYTYASTFQMLRGTLVLFTGFLTVLVLRRSLYLHHWLGMVLIAAGAAIVGAASLIHPHAAPHEPTQAPDDSMLGGMMQLKWPGLWPVHNQHHSHQGTGPAIKGTIPAEMIGPLFGDAMVVLAQAFTALQFVLEEKFLGTYRMQPLLAVGIEGAWGVVLSLAAVPLLNNIHTADGLPLDDAVSAFKAMAASPTLAAAVIGSIISIGAFNFFGLSVTQALSGASRATIDACRTILVWAVSMLAGWEIFRSLQVVGFLVLVSGTSLYNELLRSCIGKPAYLDSDEESEDPEEQNDGNEEADGTKSRITWADQAEAGQAGLQQPLLAGQEAEGAGSTAAAPPTVGHSASKRIQGMGGAHQAVAVHTMARSMRLGVHALSPHDLVDDDDDDDVGSLLGGRADVVDPMLLASTPYFGQQSGLRSMASDISSTDGASPRSSDAGDLPQFAARGTGNTGRTQSASQISASKPGPSRGYASARAIPVSVAARAPQVDQNTDAA